MTRLYCKAWRGCEQVPLRRERRRGRPHLPLQHHQLLQGDAKAQWGGTHSSCSHALPVHRRNPFTGRGCDRWSTRREPPPSTGRGGGTAASRRSQEAREQKLVASPAVSRRGGERILYFENGVVKRSGGRGERLVWSVAAGRVFHTSGLFSGEHSTLSFVWRAGELDEERHQIVCRPPRLRCDLDTICNRNGSTSLTATPTRTPSSVAISARANHLRESVKVPLFTDRNVSRRARGGPVARPSPAA